VKPPYLRTIALTATLATSAGDAVEANPDVILVWKGAKAMYEATRDTQSGVFPTRSRCS